MSGAIPVCIIGASGYTGGELLRLLAMHPNAEVVIATSREYAGKPIGYVHFNLRGFYKGLRFSPLNIDEITDKCEAVFLAVPHGASLELVPKLYETGLKILDLSADFRLKNPEEYKRWYGREHPYPDLLEKAVYGLPELHRDEIRNARLVAVPGCNATAAIFAAAPVVKEKLVDLDHLVIDVKVGSSEAGSKPSPGDHHPERENAIRPYSAEGHRHVAEVEQELGMLAGRDVRVAFVPHAVSAIRGALATLHAWLADGADEMKVWRAYAAMYGKEPFVRIVRTGLLRYPDPKYVIGTNFVDVGFAVEKRIGRMAGFAAIDNLVRGAAGQAVQSFNIMMGFDETLGLLYPPLKPA
ncbi:N-acetyl-gamma-glutamyl-phosphate reductase [Pyrolobus fumarii]|uniref:N-acetyl-gamma-glutamyl-phosphate reductase n=1 Tax=Pyrolobus fumarii TaxID=54252 RepID=UPI00064EE485|nr:N-acetyl-gamma-glutamyl-phosphate reductase [Pyrolobus fumarii]